MLHCIFQRRRILRNVYGKCIIIVLFCCCFRDVLCTSLCRITTCHQSKSHRATSLFQLAQLHLHTLVLSHRRRLIDYCWFSAFSQHDEKDLTHFCCWSNNGTMETNESESGKFINAIMCVGGWWCFSFWWGWYVLIFKTKRDRKGREKEILTIYLPGKIFAYQYLSPLLSIIIL
jgi:hypothetical protein